MRPTLARFPIHAAFLLLASLSACASTQQASIAEARKPTPVATVDADQLFAAQKWAEAADAYRERVAAKPEDGMAWYRLGYCLHVTGRLDEAIEAHARAAKFPGLRAAATYNLACAKALKGDTEAALTELERAIDAGFADAKTFAADTDLATLRAHPRFAQIAARLAPKGEGTPQHRELDFWIGDWDVFDPAGQRVGGNVITKAERGFLIHERWTDGAGRTGQSLNFVDAADGRWKQVWIDDFGNSVWFTGSFRDGAMHFEGTRSLAPGKTAQTRCTFTPNPDGSVRQLIEDRRPDGEWVASFDGKYVPRRK
jgi:hypothetical protein